jgi:hypothetical protein
MLTYWKNGRSERIRTSGPYVPNVVLYQAELHSDTQKPGNEPRSGTSGRAVYTEAASPKQATSAGIAAGRKNFMNSAC